MLKMIINTINTITQIRDKKNKCNTISKRIWKVRVKLTVDQKQKKKENGKNKYIANTK